MHSNKSRRKESQIKSPEWHGNVLRERAEAVKSGKEIFPDWETVKKQLRKKLT
jgi:Putative addiction module component